MDLIKILLVEPDPEMRATLAHLLESLDCEVTAAPTGEAAIGLFVPGRYPAMVVDAGLPGIDGIDLVTRIRTLDPVCEPIVMTSLTDQRVAVRALEAGVRNFLPKPFAEDDLRDRLKRALQANQEAVSNHLRLGELIRIKKSLSRRVAGRERFLDNLVDAAPFGIVSAGEDGRIASFNRRAQAIYGYAREDVIGQSVSTLGDLTPQTQGKAIHRKSGGQTFPVFVRTREVLNEREEVTGRLYAIEDLTERETLESQLLYAERLSLLGQMAPRIAHELKGPLQVIVGNTDLASMWMEQSDPGRASESLGAIKPAVDQILTLVQQMLNLGKPTDQQIVALDLQVELDRLVESLRPLGALRHCKVVWEVPVSPLPAVMADRSQFEQAFRNLVINAAHAMEEATSTELHIELWAHDGFVHASIRDTGCGIPDDILSRIFQPFFTTKPEDKGTGLGLPIVKTVVDRLGGDIAVTSEVGVGTTFTVSLPAHQKSEDAR